MRGQDNQSGIEYAEKTPHPAILLNAELLSLSLKGRGVDRRVGPLLSGSQGPEV